MKFILIAIFIILGVSCSTQKPAADLGVRNELQAKASDYRMLLDPRDQYNKAIQMVNGSPSFSHNQKVKLNALIGEFALKSQELKIKEGQYRAVLINEMLDSGKSSKATTKILKNNLAKINSKNSDQLESFIKDFQEIAGGAAKANESLILQTLSL